MSTRPQRLVASARRRMAWQRATGAAETAAAAVLAAGLLAQLATLVFPYPVRLEWVLAGSGAGAVLGGLVGLLARRPTATEAAHCLDRHFHLDDRLVTWLAVQHGQARSRLVPHFLADAERAVAGVRVARALPVRPRRWKALSVLLACVVAWDAWLAGTSLPHTPAGRVAEVVRREGRRLEELGRRWEQHARARGLVEALRGAQKLREVARQLAGPRATAEEGQRHLAELVAHLQGARAQVQAEVQQVGAQMGPEGVRAWAVRALESELSRLGHTLEVATLTPEQAERVRRALDHLRAAAPLAPGSPGRAALEEAKRRWDRKDQAGAREAARKAEEVFRELARLLEDEGALASQQREAEASSVTIGQALAGGGDPEAAQERPVQVPGVARQRAGADRAPDDPEAWTWEGPQEGTQPGAGQLADKLGPATPRLPARHVPERLQGQMGQGKVYTGHVQAPGVPGQARTPLLRVSPRVVRQLDEAMRAERVPAPYREWVRRYFWELGAGR